MSTSKDKHENVKEFVFQSEMNYRIIEIMERMINVLDDVEKRVQKLEKGEA